MLIKQVSMSQAIEILRSYGLEYPLWVNGSVQNGEFQAVVCDYSRLGGYTVRYAVAVYHLRSDRLVCRFNVMK